MPMPCAILSATMSSSILADDDAVLVIDETGFSQAGQGVVRRGAAIQPVRQARLRTARSASLLPTLSRHGHAFIDRTLYLPKEWTDDPDRLEATYVPADTGFATKPKLATAMIARAIVAAVPFRWVAADTVYVSEISTATAPGRQRLCARGQQRSCVPILGQAAISLWRRCGHCLDAAFVRLETPVGRDGTKGPRLHDWCYLELADLDAGQFNSAMRFVDTRSADPSSLADDDRFLTATSDDGCYAPGRVEAYAGRRRTADRVSTKPSFALLNCPASRSAIRDSTNQCSRGLWFPSPADRRFQSDERRVEAMSAAAPET